MIKRKISLLVILSLVVVMALTACGGKEAPEEPVVANPPEEAVEMTITHELGTAVLNKNPETIVVFDYATLDTLDEMGIEIAALPKSNIPTYLDKYNDEKYEDVGTLFEPNYEKIFELNPDVILISARQATVYEELQKIAPTVYLTTSTTDYIGTVNNNIRTLGELFGKEDFAEEKIKAINDGVKEVNDKAVASGKNALVVMVNEGNLSAYGPGSRFGVIHGEFGFTAADEGIEVSNHGQSITFEYLAEKNPDYIFVIDRAATVGGSTSAEQTLNNDIVKMTDAYKNNQIIYLNSQIWYVSSGGLKGTSIMIEEINNAIK